MFQYSDVEAVRHLFAVAASLDSMVVGEAQILSQVKQAFAVAQEQQMAGPVIHLVFEAAHRVAKRVATETEINRRRVSIPSVAVADFAKQLFETFHDKHVLLLGAGDMGEETLRYLRDEGARQIVILNRSCGARRGPGRTGRGRRRCLGTARRPDSPGQIWWSARPVRSEPVVTAQRLPPDSPSARTSGPCSSWTWRCRAISTRPSGSSATCISIASTI